VKVELELMDDADSKRLNDAAAYGLTHGSSYQVRVVRSYTVRRPGATLKDRELVLVLCVQLVPAEQ